MEFFGEDAASGSMDGVNLPSEQVAHPPDSEMIQFSGTMNMGRTLAPP